MKRIFQYIFIALTFSVMSFSLNSCRQKGVIDEDVLSQIYADMLMTDQWISSTAGVRLIADTSLVYEPILKKYGHTSADYRNSVEHYLKDPEEYADIMKGTVDILEKRLTELRELKGIQQQNKERADFLKEVSKNVAMDPSWVFFNWLEDERYGLIDSLSIQWDTLTNSFRMKTLPWSEKIERPDSLSVTDSIASLDSLHVLDSLARPDSLEILDSLPHQDTVVNFENAKKPMTVNGFNMSKLKKNGLLNVSDSLKKVK